MGSSVQTLRLKRPGGEGAAATFIAIFECVSRDIAAMNWGVLALVLIVICCHIENTNSREIITRKFSDMCEIKFYGVQNFIVEHDKFDKTTAKRRSKTDRSLETLGNCCWALYTKRKYKGKRIMLGSNVKVKKLRRVGRGRRKIRSIERYDGCNFVPRMI